MSDNLTFAQVVSLHDSQKKIPVMSLVKDKPLAAMLSKAVSPTIQPMHTASGTRKIETPNIGVLHSIASKTAENISHADTVMQMLPDMALGAQILVSSIISPKDMMTLQLTYKTTPGILPPSLMATVMGSVKEHFEGVYKTKNKIPRILNEVLFEKGSHVVAVLPENSIDELINRNNAISMESLSKALDIESKGNINPRDAIGRNIGILGPSDNEATRQRPNLGNAMFSIGNESLEEIFTSHAYSQHDFSQRLAHPTSGNNDGGALGEVFVTDNPNVLRIPQLEDKLRKDSLVAKLNLKQHVPGMENYNGPGIKLDDRSLKRLIYKPRRRGVETMTVVKTDRQLDRRSIGRPLIMELPSEAVIPVYTPGQEERHVGYFLLIDQTGNPINTMNQKDSFGELSARLQRSGSQTNNITNRLQQLAGGLQCGDTGYGEQFNRIYADMVEQDLLARLRNGSYTSSVEIAKNEDFYRVMLSRVLQQQHTTVLFLPSDLIVYFARKYNKYGVGVSILDEMKILNNMRAIAIMSNTILGIKNSIPRTGLELTLDPDDPDPYKTAETTMQEIIRVNQTAIPFGATAPVDISDYLQRAQYQVNIKGHPAVPEVGIEYTEKSTSYSMVDTQLEESLQKRALMSFGLNSEHINNGFNSETATSVVANNLSLSRRVMVIQDQMNPHITDLHKKILRVDEDILELLREKLEEGYDSLGINEEEFAREAGVDKTNIKFIVISHLIDDIIEGLEVTLPRPDTASIKNQKEALDEYTSLLDIAIDSYISDEFFTDETAGEMSRSVDSVKKMLRAHFIRAYMAENGIMTEISAITTLGDDGEAEFDLWHSQSEHITKLSKTMSGFMKRILKAKQEGNKVVEQMNAIVDPSDNDLGGGGGDTSPVGDDEFPLGDDFGAEETPIVTEEETPTEPTLSDMTTDDDGGQV